MDIYYDKDNNKNYYNIVIINRYIKFNIMIII